MSAGDRVGDFLLGPTELRWAVVCSSVVAHVCGLGSYDVPTDKQFESSAVALTGGKRES